MRPLYKGRCQSAQNSGDTPDHFPDSVVTDIKPVRNVPDAREITQIPQRYKKVFFWCYTRSTSCGRWACWEFALVIVVDCCQSCFKRCAGHPEMAAKIIQTVRRYSNFGISHSSWKCCPSWVHKQCTIAKICIHVIHRFTFVILIFQQEVDQSHDSWKTTAPGASLFWAIMTHSTERQHEKHQPDEDLKTPKPRWSLCKTKQLRCIIAFRRRRSTAAQVKRTSVDTIV